MMWLNGWLVERGEIAASGAGQTLGWGVFTTLGVRNGEPRLLARHVARLERDARAANVPFELDFGAIRGGLDEVLRANRTENGLARLTLTKRGDGRWNREQGADFSILSLEAPRPASPPAGALRVQLSPYRAAPRRALCGVKTTSYLDTLFAHQAAKVGGFDDAILRDERDFLSEASRASLFWVRDQVVFTPSLGTGCLRGIGRELTLEWAKISGLELQQGEFPAEKAESATEIWLVSAASGPRAIASWHGENGDLRAEFSLQNPVQAAFSHWFEALEA